MMSENSYPERLDPNLPKKVMDDVASGLRQSDIARKYRITKYHVKRLSDPEWAKMYKESRKRYNAAYVRQADRISQDYPLYDPRRDGKVYHASTYSEFFGDPLPGRSALDQKRKYEN